MEKSAASVKVIIIFEKQCFTKGKKSQGERIQLVEKKKKETALSDTFSVGMVMQEDAAAARMDESSVNTVEQDTRIEALHVNGAVIKFKLDTGAKANLVNEHDI